jgi:hypothetical protein
MSEGIIKPFGSPESRVPLVFANRRFGARGKDQSRTLGCFSFLVHSEAGGTPSAASALSSGIPFAGTSNEAASVPSGAPGSKVPIAAARESAVGSSTGFRIEKNGVRASRRLSIPCSCSRTAKAGNEMRELSARE